MLRIAALASSVVASMAIVLPLRSPTSTSRCCTQVKTARCVSTSIRRRVREIVE
jgi:hypothetical protein